MKTLSGMARQCFGKDHAFELVETISVIKLFHKKEISWCRRCGAIKIEIKHPKSLKSSKIEFSNIMYHSNKLKNRVEKMEKMVRQLISDIDKSSLGGKYWITDRLDDILE